MSTRTKTLYLILLTFLFTGVSSAFADGLTLYTPYTKITVPPGESIDYSIDVINNGSVLRNVGFTVSGLPKGWDYNLKAGGWNISQLSVLPGEKKTVSLTVEVPLQVNKGNYRFTVSAPGLTSLPLNINISEQGSYKTEFTANQPNMEGASKSTFTFNVELKNRTAEAQLYALQANAPRGWTVAFKPNYKQATSVNVEPNATASFNIDINPPQSIAEGVYKIPVRATTSATSAELELEVVITGSYNLELTTPTGLLSSRITAGDQKQIELSIRNTGSSELKDIKLTSSKPVDWEVSFEPQKIDRLEPGKTAQVFAVVKPDKKAIAGDYAVSIDANTPEASSKASFRISVRTSVLWGGLGVLIIFVALAGVYRLFQKYGRR